MVIRPHPGEWYVHNNEAYRVMFVSRGTDVVVVKRLSDSTLVEVMFGTFKTGFKRAFKVGAVAKMIGRSPRSIYRYESSGLIQKAKRYPDEYGRAIRFYTKQDVVDLHQMVSELHGGRPRKDGLIVNNTMPSRAELLIDLRERYGE